MLLARLVHILIIVIHIAYLLNHLIRLQNIQRCSQSISDHKGGAP